MPPKRSPVDPIGTRSKTKKQKQDAPTVNNTGERTSTQLSPQCVETIVDAVLVAMEKRGLVSQVPQTPIHNFSNTACLPTTTEPASAPTTPDQFSGSAHTSNVMEHVQNIFTRSSQPSNTQAPASTSARNVTAPLSCQPEFFNVNIAEAPATTSQEIGVLQQTGTASFHSQNLQTLKLSPSALISDKVRQTIWKKEYVELSSLLKSQPEEMMLKVNAQNELVMMPKTSNKLMNINAWISAFTIYMDIYVQAHPDEFSTLLTYMNNIRDLERGYGQAAFNFYDRSFRAHLQSQQLSWGSIQSELWVRATTLPLRAEESSAGTMTKRYCYDFNKAKGCSKRLCHYAHICSNCRKNHPSFKCFSKQVGLKTSKTTSPRHLSNATQVPSSTSAHSFRNNSNKK